MTVEVGAVVGLISDAPPLPNGDRGPPRLAVWDARPVAAVRSWGPPGPRPAGGATVEDLLRRRSALPTGDPGRVALRVRSVEAGLPLARGLARRYRGLGEPLDDLYQVAALGLVKAVDGYDPARQSAFTSYAVPTILGALKRHFRDSTWHVRVHRRHKELAVSIGPARAGLTQQLGRPPKLAELATHLGAAEDDVTIALNARRLRHPESLNAWSEIEGSPGPPLIETIGGTDAGFEATTDWHVLHPLLAALPDRERRVVVMRYFADLTQAEIAIQLGLSQMHVSRLLARTLRCLRVQMRAGRPSRARSAAARDTPEASGTATTTRRARGGHSQEPNTRPLPRPARSGRGGVEERATIRPG
jgi:RNA polymerase sigma-B factor